MGQSWSAVQKLLEQEYLCETLRGRVTYFVTRYPKCSDLADGIAVAVDGQEILRTSFTAWRKACIAVDQEMPDASMEEREMEAHNRGGFDLTVFYEAFYTYQNQPIALSLAAEDPVIRLFAILDRRVGKRTLEKLCPTIPDQPNWLRPFYQLRLKTEGFHTNDKSKMRG